MKSIVVNISEVDLNDMQITQDEISFDELKQKWKMQAIRSKRALLAKLAQSDGLEDLSETEIFNMLKEDKAACN